MNVNENLLELDYINPRLSKRNLFPRFLVSSTGRGTVIIQ